MEPKRVLVLRRNEWNRLKKEASSHVEEPPSKEKEHIKTLIEQSQEWIKMWPDSVQGYVRKFKNQKEKQRDKDLATIREFNKRKHESNTDLIMQEAKQLIFENSCDGRLLISALLQSKTLEERDVQLKLKKEMKKMEPEYKSSSNDTFFKFKENFKDNDSMTKDKNKEIAQINKYIYETQKTKKAIEKGKETQLELEDARLMKEFLEKEKQTEKCYKSIEKQTLEEAKREQKEIRARKETNEHLEEALNEVWLRYQDRRRCKEKRILEAQIHKRQPSKQNYDLIKKLQEEKESRLENFIIKAVKQREELALHKEKELMEAQKRETENIIKISQENKIVSEMDRAIRQFKSSCTCDRGSLFINSERRNNKIAWNSRETEALSFLKKSSKVEELKKREKEQSPFSGTKGAHAQFAQYASGILKECQYKHMARKVIDEYRKENNLDLVTLPVTN